jgi:hypothetical protein
MTDSIRWTCKCGAVAATITPDSGTRAVCYCVDCQAFARHLGHPDLLDDAGGSDLYQTTPDKIDVSKGREHLACLRLSDKGPLRWFTDCCKTPMANTAGTMNLPFASMTVPRFDDADKAGPVIARLNRKSALRPVSEQSGSVLRLVGGFAYRVLATRLSGRHKTTPFFARDGKPVASPKRLSDTERTRAYSRDASR